MRVLLNAQDAAGAGLAGLTPTFVKLIDRTNADIAQPSIVDLGSGLYLFELADALVTDENSAGYIVDFGTDDAVPRYASGGHGKDVFVALFDPDTGAPMASGVGMVVQHYSKLDGTTPASSPLVSNRGGGLYGFNPSSEDVEEGRAFVLQAIDLSPFAFLPGLIVGIVEAAPSIGSGGGGPVLPPGTGSGITFIEQLDPGAGVDFGSDVSTFPDLDGTFELMTGRRVLAEALFRRLLTVAGGLPFHPDYGEDVRAFLSEAGTADSLFRLRSRAEAQCLLDERVAAAVATARYDQPEETLTLTIDVQSEAGPFALTVGVTALTTTLLAED